ncbi:hypothetical protein LX32DRAFT_642128 [Colletotrichum zoysiae]|uniref:Complex III subunit 9 n=1 Tax=Colletotrichum zoysiae TaxID=1216348 RepID=A0AAD9HDT1_9PEZI|nr:hypothetical protein LX32DRAFT_642128 [Colletotrichum zoysiae]
MLGFVFATGFAFEMGFNGAMNKYWDYLNRGVSINEPVSRETSVSLRRSTFGHSVGMDLLTRSRMQRQWKDIRHKYIESADDDE